MRTFKQQRERGNDRSAHASLWPRLKFLIPEQSIKRVFGFIAFVTGYFLIWNFGFNTPSSTLSPGESASPENEEVGTEPAFRNVSRAPLAIRNNRVSLKLNLRTLARHIWERETAGASHRPDRLAPPREALA